MIILIIITGVVVFLIQINSKMCSKFVVCDILAFDQLHNNYNLNFFYCRILFHTSIM